MTRPLLLLLLASVLLTGCGFVAPGAAVMMAPPVVQDGILYVHRACDVTAYDAKTGALLWKVAATDSEKLEYCKQGE